MGCRTSGVRSVPLYSLATQRIRSLHFNKVTVSWLRCVITVPSLPWTRGVDKLQRDAPQGCKPPKRRIPKCRREGREQPRMLYLPPWDLREHSLAGKAWEARKRQTQIQEISLASNFRLTCPIGKKTFYFA